MNFATIIDTDITISTSGTALEGTDYGNVADITISAGDKLELQHLLQLTIPSTREMKQQQLQWLQLQEQTLDQQLLKP